MRLLPYPGSTTCLWLRLWRLKIALRVRHAVGGLSLVAHAASDFFTLSRLSSVPPFHSQSTQCQSCPPPFCDQSKLPRSPQASVRVGDTASGSTPSWSLRASLQDHRRWLCIAPACSPETSPGSRGRSHHRQLASLQLRVHSLSA